MSEVPRETFLDYLSRSRLVEPAHLGAVTAEFPTATADELADALVSTGVLTQFQARKLLRGRWQGLLLGPYRVLSPLGRGGMGMVYLARDTREPEAADFAHVALKVLPPKLAREEPRMFARFQREIELGKRVSHENVTRTLEGGAIENVNFLAMEFVAGQTVREHVKQSGSLSVGNAARVFAEVAAGLAGIHASGLIHRDLKPGNIMLTPSGHAKILDLGLALVPGEAPPDDRKVIGGKGYIVGTMDYISPEQARDATDVTARSDIYSLGCSLYFALTGTPPFPGGTSFDKIRWQRTVPHVPLMDLNRSVPARFAELVDALMEKRPEDRPESAGAVRELLLPFATPAPGVAGVVVPSALAAAYEGGDSTSWHDGATGEPGDGDAEPAGQPWLVIAGVVGAVVAIIAVLLLLRRM